MKKKEPGPSYRVLYKPTKAGAAQGVVEGMQADRLSSIEEAADAKEVCEQWFNKRKIAELGKQGDFDVLLSSRVDTTKRVEVWIESFDGEEWKKVDGAPTGQSRGERLSSPSTIAGTQIPAEVPA